jgi:uncharacterized protein (TIGR02588 family)
MKKPKKNPLEWTVFMLSFLLVLFLWGYLLYHVFAKGTVSPPMIQVAVQEPKPFAAGFMVEVDLRNSGGETAENVQVEVVLRNGTTEIEKAEFQIAYIPRHSRRNGYVVFQTNPSSVERIDASVVGFEIP